MTEAYLEAKKRIKALQELEKHSAEEVVSWVKKAIDTQYPAVWKKAYEIVRRMTWGDIRTEIFQTVESQDYEKIHHLLDEMLKTDLLNRDIMEKLKIVKDMGNLAVFYDRNLLLPVLQTINEEVKDAKLETYLLYRCFMGKPRLSNGRFRKKF